MCTLAINADYPSFFSFSRFLVPTIGRARRCHCSLVLSFHEQPPSQELLQHSYAATLQSDDTLSRAYSSETKVFQTERPSIFTLCQLAWTLARNSRSSEAIRVFDETVRRQREYYGRENVLPETSLENLTRFLYLGRISWVLPESSRALRGNNPASIPSRVENQALREQTGKKGYAENDYGNGVLRRRYHVLYRFARGAA